MISVRGIWPLRLATLWYEPLGRVQEYLHGYARVHVYAYEPLSLPGFRMIREKQTPLISVKGKTLETVLATFRDTTRNEIRRTFAMPDLTFSIEEPSRELYDFYVAATRSQTREPQKRGLFRGARIAVARRGSMILAAIAFVPACPVVKVLTISSLRRESPDAGERNLIGFATKRLVYELCAYAIAGDYEYVDLAYVNTTDPAKKGITDFKMGFGGEIRHEWQYERKTSFLNLVRYLRSV